MMKTTEVQIGSKVWKVQIEGEICRIVDDQGRERHRSRGHELTGVYLAMAIADRADPEMEFNGPINEALKRRAQEPLKGESDADRP
jgi:hypothetical protein